MAATIRKIGQIPSQLSEINPFGGFVVYGNLRWGVSLGNRVYIGAPYADNRVYAYENGVLEALGRASIPTPYPFTGDASAPFEVTPVNDFNTTGSGDIDPAVTPVRYYGISWASEQTAQFLAYSTNLPAQNGTSGSTQFPIYRFNPETDSEYLRTQTDQSYAETLGEFQTATPIEDARSAFNIAPMGTFGNMATTFVTATLATGNTAVLIDTVDWTVHADFLPNVTHAYIWASDTPYNEGGQFRFVGKIPYDPTTGFGGKVLYDTLSADALAGRNSNVQDWLPVPSFTAAAKVKGRMVGIAGGSKISFNSDVFSYWVNVDSTNLRKLTLASDVGGTISTNEWPRCLEIGGMGIVIEGSSDTYEIDYIDPNDRQVAYLSRDFQGTPDDGLTMQALGSNKLMIMPVNLQQQEVVRVQWTLDGFREFGNALITVADDPNADGFFVFTNECVFYISGLPSAEDTQAPLGFPIRKRLVSKDYGAAGITSVCAVDKVVMAMTLQGDLVSVSSTSVQPLSNDALLNFLRSLTFVDKSLCTMAYDSTRKLLYMIFPYFEGVARTPGTWPGMDAKEIAVVLNTDTGGFTVWHGGRWRYVLAVAPAGEGGTGAGSGAQMLFQDWKGDVVLLDENRLVDKDAGVPFVSLGTVTSVASGYVEFSPTQVLSPYLRGQYVVVVSGTNSGSFAEVIRRRPSTVGIDIGDWSDGAPAVGDTCIIGCVEVSWQTGAITATPETLPFGTVVGFKAEMDNTNDAQTWWKATFQTFASGRTSQLPAPTAPTTEAEYTQAQIETGMRMPIAKSGRSTRVISGVEWAQPPIDGSNQGADYRIRMNALNVMGLEDRKE